MMRIVGFFVSLLMLLISHLIKDKTGHLPDFMVCAVMIFLQIYPMFLLSETSKKWRYRFILLVIAELGVLFFCLAWGLFVTGVNILPDLAGWLAIISVACCVIYSVKISSNIIFGMFNFLMCFV